MTVLELIFEHFKHYTKFSVEKDIYEDEDDLYNKIVIRIEEFTSEDSFDVYQYEDVIKQKSNTYKKILKYLKLFDRYDFTPMIVFNDFHNNQEIEICIEKDTVIDEKAINMMKSCLNVDKFNL